MYRLKWDDERTIFNLCPIYEFNAKKDTTHSVAVDHFCELSWETASLWTINLSPFLKIALCFCACILLLLMLFSLFFSYFSVDVYRGGQANSIHSKGANTHYFTINQNPFKWQKMKKKMMMKKSSWWVYFALWVVHMYATPSTRIDRGVW